MNKRLPLGLLAILLIVLLAGIGVAYGLWAETLTIDGTVNTGEVDVNFGMIDVKEMVSIDGADPVLESLYPSKVGAANCDIEVEFPLADDPTLEVTVTGAYPSWHCIVDFEIKSVGSVPVHVYLPEADDDEDNPGWAVPECDDIDPVDGYIQLHENEIVDCQLVIHFTNEDYEDGLVDEGEEYTLLYTIEARQWNEPRP
jgi:hypothetical protein